MAHDDLTKLRDFFDGLAGAWDLEKQITPGGVFTGTASFDRISDDILDYSEIGRLVTDAQVFEDVSQTYRYVFEDGISVYFRGFREGLFHRLTEDGNLLQGSHFCDPDQYETQYEISGDGFAIHHQVTGPKKDYQIRARYRRKA